MGRPWGLAIAVVAVLVVAVVGGPRPLALPDVSTGDGALAARVRAALGPRPGTRAVAVALVTPDQVRTAGIGRRDDAGAPVTADTPFEIGSVTKAMTSMLLADETASDAVRLDATVGEVLGGELAAAPVGEVTLRELAQHRSGLPQLGSGGPVWLVRMVLARFTGLDPYRGWSAQDVRDAAAADDLDGRGEFAYSNLGGALLGQAVGRADGRGYQTALREQVLAPVGMRRTTLVTEPSVLPDDRADGVTATGVQRDPWIGAGYLPAGVGVWSTAADMGRFVQQTMTGAAPGASAARPRSRVTDDQRIGLGWFTDRTHDRTITWHNGGTGGFSSWVGFDRDARRGVAVLSASDEDVERLGEHLLGAGPPPAAVGWSLPGWRGLVPVGLAAVAVMSAWQLARTGRRDGVDDWLGLAAGFGQVAALLVFVWVLGPWTVLPWWLWSVVAGACAVGAVVAVAAAGRVPVVREGATRWSVINAVVQTLLPVALLALLFAL